MAGASPEQTGADDAVAHNHDGGENRVARQPRFFGWSCDHDRNNQCRLNHGYCQGENKRAERLADAVCNHLRVVHGREHRGQQRKSSRRRDDALAAEKQCHQRITHANTGHVQVHQGVCVATVPMLLDCFAIRIRYTITMRRTNAAQAGEPQCAF